MLFDPHVRGHLIHRDNPPVLSALGPTVQPLTIAGERDSSAPGLVHGVMPPGQVVPMHAHADPETFLVQSGRVEALAVTASGPEWVTVSAGQIFHVPGNARHAWRNRSSNPVNVLIITTAQLVGYFDEIGTPVEDVDPTQPPTSDAMQRFMTANAVYGYWTASPEENTAVGIELPPIPA